MRTLFSWLLLMIVALLFDQVKSQAITALQFARINTTVIANLTNGATISLATFLSGTWTIVALATTSTKSVAFSLDGNSTFRTENSAPWSMTGNHPVNLPFQRGN
jgi:hypothetical protein